MARNDPSDTGGLFVGPRKGASAPVHLPDAPARGSERRQRADRTLAAGILVVETLLCLSLFGPQPAAWLWIGSQVEYLTGNVVLGFCTIILGCLASLMLTLALAKRVDHAWKLARRAGGHPPGARCDRVDLRRQRGRGRGGLRLLVPRDPGPGADPGPQHLMRAAAAAPSHISA